jgi:hypothetical protein
VTTLLRCADAVRFKEEGFVTSLASQMESLRGRELPGFMSSQVGVNKKGSWACLLPWIGEECQSSRSHFPIGSDDWGVGVATS